MEYTSCPGLVHVPLLGLGSGISLTQPQGLQVGEGILPRKSEGLLLERDVDPREGKNNSAHNRYDDFLR